MLALNTLFGEPSSFFENKPDGVEYNNYEEDVFGVGKPAILPEVLLELLPLTLDHECEDVLVQQKG
jgi:hypothetical protein